MNDRTFSSQEISLGRNTMIVEEEKKDILLTIDINVMTILIIFSLLFLVFSE
jgi:hypothetical protein